MAALLLRSFPQITAVHSEDPNFKWDQTRVSGQAIFDVPGGVQRSSSRRSSSSLVDDNRQARQGTEHALYTAFPVVSFLACKEPLPK